MRLSFKILVFAVCVFVIKKIWFTFDNTPSGRIVNIYNWAEFISPEILEKFTKETGIKVHYDVFDTNEVLEAKLLTGKTGYDVVFPSANPYFQRLKQSKVLQKIDKSKIKNFHLIDPVILSKLNSIDKNHEYGIPYLWGTAGFAYNSEMVEKIMGKPLASSWNVLFNPEILAKLCVCGVSLMDSPVELFPAILKSQGKNPKSSKIEDLNGAINALLSIRPYIRKFTSVIVNDLASGDLCLVQTWSADARLARDKAKMNIKYVVPEEGTSLWMDVMAIPEDAPHVEEAHIFIDFLLKPENIGQITNAVYCANAIPSSGKFINPEILKDGIVYPSKRVIEKSYTDDLFSATFERLRNRAMIKVKTGR
jgi:putrescine transport system substrate-binding protein